MSLPVAMFTASYRAVTALCGCLVFCRGLIAAPLPDDPQTATTALLDPHDYHGPDLLTASIYSEGGRHQSLLYRFRRVATRSGATVKVLREFTYPDGSLAARERVVYEANTLRLFELEELQTGGAGFTRIQPDPREPAKAVILFEYRKSATTPPRSASLPERRGENTLVPDMVGPFLATHWEQLYRGERVACRQIVLPHQDTVGFSFKKESESTWRGRNVITLKMQPSSVFISALVDPLFITVETAPPHRVLQYVGRTSPKVQERGGWKDLDAVTVFDW